MSQLKGSALEGALKLNKTELDQLAISTSRKQAFKDRLTALQKAFDDADKAAKAAQLKEAVDKVNQLLETSSDPFIVAKFEGIDNKSLNGVVNHVKTKGIKAALFLNVDASGSRVMHQCFVPKVN
jgi:alanyl-tRNA synthetase